MDLARAGAEQFKVDQGYWSHHFRKRVKRIKEVEICFGI